ncbi:MAG TPA: Gfo/Idh/MocA family oxidoreductase [Candidatus Saccharimonadales bacterium]|nr:Gfo/Idh/MocA family oxidoreductase [Candidatus Saccharimonadales bacterium]
MSRRQFIRYTTLLTGATAVAGPYVVRGQNLNSRVQVGVIGAGGKGSSDTDDTAKVGGVIYALCDVDKGTLEARGKKYPEAKRYQDFRKMLTELDKDLDAVIVATPDHMHAPASTMAMSMKKHCFCQKPLTHSVFEARRMRELSKKMKVATQMGNQGSAGPGLRRAVEVIQAGVIGKPLELHVWSNRPIWPQGINRPPGEDPVPDTLDWNQWLGPAPFRPYKKDTYHAFKWRGWQDFGTGALGDMACHTVNMPFRALKLGYPTEIEAESTGINKETYARSSKIRFQFPAREGLPPLTFWWYDGKPDGEDTFRPHPDLTSDIVAKQGKLPGSGCLIIGDKGRIFSPDDYGSQFFVRLKDEKDLRASKDHEAVKPIPETIPRSPGHYKEWMDAMHGGPAAYSNFDIAAYLTEIILLGCVALRVGHKLEWNGPKMKATNCSEAAQYVKREYREGWKLS